MKLYVGNLGDKGEITADDLRPIFEQYGTVTECEVIKNYAFVHISEADAANQAVQQLNGYTINGRDIKVEKSESKGPKKPSHKLFVGNIKEGTTNDELRAVFEPYSKVLEADVIKNFGFIHIDANAGKAKINEILRDLNGYSLNGSQIRVQQSTSGVRQKPGMGGDSCYRCGGTGHWSRECPNQDYSGGRSTSRGGRGGPMRDYDRGGNSGPYSRGEPYPPPPPPAYMRERSNYDSGYNSYSRSGLGGAGGPMRSNDLYSRGQGQGQPMYDRRPYTADSYSRDAYAAQSPASADPYGYGQPAYGAPPSGNIYSRRSPGEQQQQQQQQQQQSSFPQNTRPAYPPPANMAFGGGSRPAAGASGSGYGMY